MAAKKNFSLVDFIRVHPEYENIGPQGLALYYHLATEKSASHPYGFWKTTKSWAANLPLEREDIVVGINALQNTGLIVRDERAMLIYAIGAPLCDRAQPTTQNLARRWIDKMPESPLRFLWAYEVMLNARGRNLQTRQFLDSRLVPYFRSLVKTEILSHLPNGMETGSVESDRWEDFCSYGMLLLSKVFTLLENGSKDNSLGIENMLESSKNAIHCEKSLTSIRCTAQHCSDANQARKKLEKPKTPGLRDLLLRMAAIYEEETGKTYAINWQMEPKMGREALQSLTSVEIQGRFRSFLADPWFKEKGYQDFRRFFNSINRWEAKAASVAVDDDWFQKLVDREKGSSV